MVGIINADNLFQFPDFRSTERAFQLITQVSGRAGRRQKQGTVLIQTSMPKHPIFKDIIENNYRRFYQRESMEREKFIYPPFCRLIMVNLKHKKPKLVREAALIFADLLTQKLGNRVRGPSEPGVGRVRGFYLQNILIKLEKKNSAIKATKEWIIIFKNKVQETKGLKSVRINIDVDPF